MERKGNNQFNASWSEEEERTIRELHDCMFWQESELIFPNRTAKAVMEKGKIFKLHRGRRKIFFPRIYQNDVDGGYVTGLIDGEGSFTTCVKSKDGNLVNLAPRLQINLRADDREIIEWLRNYFNCGLIQDIKKNNIKRNPVVCLTIYSLYDIMKSVIPHFDIYPLRAKKAKDYEIWKKMVLMQAEFYRRPWTTEIRHEMNDLYKKLKNIRLFNEEVTKTVG